MSIALSLLDPTQTYTGRKQFDCGHSRINKFVHDSLVPQVKKQLSVAYVLTDSAHDNRFVGFFTIANHAIDASALSVLQRGSLPKTIPCSRLIMLGVDVAYQKQNLGLRMMKKALTITLETSKHLGCYGMYLDADASALVFYTALGFTALEGDKSPLPSPMFLPISAIAKPESR